MLDLTFMFSGTLAPVVGARKVNGRAMSDSGSSATIAPTAIDLRIRAERMKTLPRTKAHLRMEARKRNIEQLFRAAMVGRDWLTTTEVAKLVGYERQACLHTLKRLNSEGFISMREQRKTGRQGVALMWQWNP